MLSDKAILKGYKVTDSDRKQKIGIAAKSLEQLKEKTLTKLQTTKYNGELPKLPKDIYFQLVDGTRIESEEYFQSLPSQTTIVWVEVGKTAETDAERLYKSIREVNLDYLSTGVQVQDFVMTELKSKMYKLVQQLEKFGGDDKAKLNTREEHPEWFEGLDTRSKTKEEYLFRRAQDRIRSYYYKTREELKTGEAKNNSQIQKLLEFLKKQLTEDDYFGCYFDRSRCKVSGDTPLKCLCDEIGTFTCKGMWNSKACAYEPKHTINPYATRESRILFQTWNLDHRIERKRFIVPAVLGTKKIDFQLVYNDLFTLKNLKLVNIVCHDKCKHAEAVNNYDINNQGGDECDGCRTVNLNYELASPGNSI